MYKALVVDDVKNFRDNLKGMLADHCESVEVVGEVGSLKETKAWIEANGHDLDVAFLDIHLQDGNIFELLSSLDQINFDIIFVTGESERSVEASFYSSLGFIPKPIDQVYLKRAVGQLDSIYARRNGTNNPVREELTMLQDNINNPNSFCKLSIPTSEGYIFIEYPDIIRLEGENNYTNIFLKDGTKVIASKTIKTYDKPLLERGFFRIHKRHIINLNSMTNFVRQGGSHVIMSDDMKIDVSRRRRPDFVQYLKNRGFGL